MMLMFFGFKQLEDLNISSFDTRNVNNMMMMFSYCKLLIELNLSLFITKNVNIIKVGIIIPQFNHSL